MNNVKLFQILSIVFLLQLIPNFGFSQESDTAEKGSLNSGTIKSQYDYLWDSSNRYQDHRVVKAFKLDKFKNNVLDSLFNLQTVISGLENEILSLNSSSGGLVSSIDSLEIDLKKAVEEKDNFSILGTSTSKSAFKTLFWIITIGLSVLLLFLFLRLKSKVTSAKDAKKNLSTLEGEFEDFKKRSREKEQVLARQLQDEINKGL